jgi:hypothetical protein
MDYNLIDDWDELPEQESDEEEINPLSEFEKSFYDDYSYALQYEISQLGINRRNYFDWGD